MTETISATSITVTATAKHKRAERLAGAMRNDLGVIDGRKNGRDQNEPPQ